MRLAWIDVPFEGQRLKDMTVQKAKELRDLGLTIVGCPNELDTSDSDIEWAKKFLEDNGLLPGPPGLGASAVRPDEDEEKKHKRDIINGVIYSGKLGAPSFRYSAGSMHPTNTWMHHPDNVTQKAMDRLVKNTRELSRYAADANCLLIPETTQWTIVNSIERMREFVDRVDSPYVRICLDPVNHMTYDRVYESGRFIKCAIGYLGDRIGTIHCKDVQIDPDKLLVSHIDEAPIGKGVFDHEALLVASRDLEPWKLLSIEHLPGGEERMPRIRSALAHIREIEKSIGHKWSDPYLTRDRWLKMQGKRIL